MADGVPMPIVDAHQHFWDLERNYYPWLCDPEPIAFRYGDYSGLRQSYLPPDYRRDSRRAPIYPPPTGKRYSTTTPSASTDCDRRTAMISASSAPPPSSPSSPNPPRLRAENGAPSDPLMLRCLPTG